MRFSAWSLTEACNVSASSTSSFIPFCERGHAPGDDHRIFGVDQELSGFGQCAGIALTGGMVELNFGMRRFDSSIGSSCSFPTGE